MRATGAVEGEIMDIDPGNYIRKFGDSQSDVAGARAAGNNVRRVIGIMERRGDRSCVPIYAGDLQHLSLTTSYIALCSGTILRTSARITADSTLTDRDVVPWSQANAREVAGERITEFSDRRIQVYIPGMRHGGVADQQIVSAARVLDGHRASRATELPVNGDIVFCNRSELGRDKICPAGEVQFVARLQCGDGVVDGRSVVG